MPLPSTRRSVPAVVGTLRILTVCTGNICRSPLAEAALRRDLRPVLGHASVEVASAGTAAMVGASADEHAARAAASLGLELDGHRGRSLSREAVEGAHLVLGLTRAHRAAALELAPSSVRRIFTMRELVLVLDSLDRPAFAPETSLGDRFAQMVDHAAGARGAVMSASDLPVDVDDPYRRSEDVHQRVAEEIAEAARRLASSTARLIRSCPPNVG